MLINLKKLQQLAEHEKGKCRWWVGEGEGEEGRGGEVTQSVRGFVLYNVDSEKCVQPVIGHCGQAGIRFQEFSYVDLKETNCVHIKNY